ncbi:hypothetical protein G6F56_013211 [Rhizopus delemar]|nr:hypothetical protein G6F56_013211 [Rhizopus delemar]
MNQLSALVELDLSCNRIKNLSPGVFGSRLKYLSLASNVLKNLSGDPFFRCEDLETINLSKNNLGSLCQHFTNRMLQLSRIKLSLIDLSHNRLCILPFELIDQEKVDTIIHGNPLIQHPNQEDEYFEAVGRLLQKAIPSNSKIRTEDYSQLDPVYGDYIDALLQFHAPATDSDEHLPPVDLSFLDYSPHMCLLLNTRVVVWFARNPIWMNGLVLYR